MEEFGEVAQRVHPVTEALPAGGSWSCLGYALSCWGTASCLLRPIRHPDRRSPQKTELLLSMANCERSHCESGA